MTATKNKKYRKYLPEYRVSHLSSPGGGDATNQFVIETADALIFQSYDSIIAVKVKRPEEGEPKVILGANWSYSRTTMKYLTKFLKHDTAETRRRLENGTYKYEGGLK